MIWKRYPVLRIFIALICGILIINFISIPAYLSIVLMVLSIAGLMITSFMPGFFGSHTLRPLFGIFSGLTFFCIGLVISLFHSERLKKDHYLYQDKLFGHFYLEVLEAPVERKNSYRTVVEIKSVLRADTLQRLSGKCIFYLEKDDLSPKLSPGDELVFKGRFSPLAEPKNPYEFDYRNYLNLKAIYAQGYTTKENWKIISKAKGFSLLRWSGNIRKGLLKVVDDWGLAKEESTVSKALLLGYRYEIENTLLRAYASAGATHVLAVSGLHVGIVYLMTFYLLYFLGKGKKGKLFRTTLLVLLLWSYALITGLSPSVVRAATMFSFVAIGDGFKRSTSIYNTILGSAIFLLLIKPTYLFEVGFQLSYLAVFGIVWMQPRLESLWRPKNWLLAKIWTITTVSLAAQLATFPLGLYYFHQFPGLFLLSNLIVIPLVSIIMYAGLIALILSAFGLPFIPLIKFYDLCLQLMNTSVLRVERLQGFLIDQIHISRWEMVLLYTLLFMGAAWLFYGGFYKLRISLKILLILIGWQVWENFDLQTKNELTFYSIKGSIALGFNNGSHFYLVGDKDLFEDEEKMIFHIRHHTWAENVESVIQHSISTEFCDEIICKKGNYLAMGNIIMWVYNNEAGYIGPADIWIVDTKYKLPPKKSLQHQPHEVVLMKQTSSFHNDRWEEWGMTNDIKITNVILGKAYLLSSL